MGIEAHITALPKQIEFAECREKNVALVGGYGSGKSQAIVYRGLSLAQRREHAIVGVIAPTYRMIEDINIPDFEEILEHYNIPYHHEKRNGIIRINSGGLSADFIFRSGDRPERIVGWEATDILLDEYDTIAKVSKQKELWRKVIARLRGAEGATIGVGTTPEGFKETYNLFQKRKIGPLIRAKTTENPFLPADYVEELRRQYDKKLIEQYLDGLFVNINGLAAYYIFDRDVHHRRAENRQIVDAPILHVGMDFNVNKMCAIVHTWDGKQLHAVDETILQRYHGTIPITEHMANLLKEKYPTSALYVYPDATGKSGSTNASQSDIAILRKAGLRVFAKNVNPKVTDRLNAVNGAFSHNRLLVDTDRCPDYTEDLEQVVRKENGDIDKSDVERTHSSDAAGYCVNWLMPVKRRTVTYSPRYQG